MGLFDRLKALFGGRDECCHQKVAPETDIAIARRVLPKDPAHAVHHIACALAHDPGCTDWLELLEAAVSACMLRNVAPLPEPGGESYYGIEGARAWIMARNGDRHGALLLIAAVHKAKPDSEYLVEWAPQWLLDLGGLPEDRLMTAARFLAATVATLPEHREANARWRRFFSAAHEAFDSALATAAPDQEFAPFLRVVLLRKAGRLDEALAFAREVLAKRPDAMVATAAARIHELRDDADGTIAAFERAFELSRDPAVLLDCGDILLEADRAEEALRYYERVPAAAPESAWATASIHYCRWKLTGGGEHLEALDRLGQGPHQRRADDLFRKHVRWLGTVPAPADATANLFRQMHAEAPAEAWKKFDLRLRVSTCEAPSNILPFEMEVRRHGGVFDHEWQVDRIPRPDPRVPASGATSVLWRFEGVKPIRIVPPPPQAIADAVGGLARRPYLLERWWGLAQGISAELPEGVASQLASAMVYPALASDGASSPQWIVRWQLAAAMILAAKCDRFRDAEASAVLRNLLLGPVDWTTTACVVAVGYMAHTHPRTVPAVAEIYAELEKREPDAFCCYRETLYECWSRLPGTDERKRSALREKLKQMGE